MALDDYLEPEIAVTAAVTAAIFSPRARKVIRKGAVYGMAGLLIAGDALTSLARSVGRGVQAAGNSAANMAQQAANTAQSATEDNTREVVGAGTGSTSNSRKAASKNTAATESAGGEA